MVAEATSAASDIIIYYDTTSGDKKSRDTVTDVLTNPWVHASYSSGQYSIYATYTAAGGSLIKTKKGLAIASVKTFKGLATASVKTAKGLTNV